MWTQAPKKICTDQTKVMALTIFSYLKQFYFKHWYKIVSWIVFSIL